MLRLLIVAGLVSLAAISAPADDTIRVMTFNIWVGGESGGQPLEQTAQVIRAARADIVGMQEAYGREVNGKKPDNGKRIAELLGWNHVDQGGGKGILSRLEIFGLTPGKQGAQLRLPSGTTFHLFNVHFFHAPYQPYQLLGIPYADAPFLKTEQELIDAARAARGGEVAAVLAEIKPLLAAGKPLALTGDFNEPSHQDWTQRAADVRIVPMKVAYPATIAVTTAGLVDTYRTLFPDETTHRGLTWTPTTAETDPKDRHDRIDFVYTSPNITISRCEIIGESNRYADIVVTPYPSDHRAVVTEIVLPE